MVIRWKAPTVRIRSGRAEMADAALDVLAESASVHQGRLRTGAELPLAQLEAVLVLRDEIDRRMHTLVAEARAAGATWDEIREVTGHASRGAAAKRFG